MSQLQRLKTVLKDNQTLRSYKKKKKCELNATSVIHYARRGMRVKEATGRCLTCLLLYRGGKITQASLSYTNNDRLQRSRKEVIFHLCLFALSFACPYNAQRSVSQSCSPGTLTVSEIMKK